MPGIPAAALSDDVLVRYEHPQLLSKKEAYTARKGLARRGTGAEEDDREETSAALKVEVLNSITPPREFEQAGQAWIQYIASAPATVSEVIALQSKFDKLLEKHEARETGICPIREALYSQCFDELIRQETVFCAERGALFLRVRDELRMTLDSLQVAYQSSLAYGVRHAIECEQAKGTMEQQMRTLNETNDDLAAEVDELKARLVSQIAERTESRAQLAEEMAAEKEALLEEEKDLMAQLDEQMMQLGLKDRPPPPKEEKKEEGK